ncbi:MAG TPA: glycosyltransferase family 2 protein [Methylomirabilota bacterium]|nr:glycosyltransferase family 2 protein [Methylomirabilota bacterium]
MTSEAEVTTLPDGRVRPRVSGLVTCYNEEHNIGACIESMSWCDEIVVVDSFSTDRTPEIARSFDKVRFYQRTYYGAGAQKNWALHHVRCPWVFLLDSDERCTPGLRREVEDLLVRGPDHLAYTINRDVFFLGKQIKHSGWQRDRVARLFKHGSAYYENRRVHSLLRTTGEAPLLKHSMEHHMVDLSFDEYAFRLAKYGYWGAAQGWRDGVRPTALEVALRPLWRFIRTYVIQLGVLDGGRGLVFCALQAYSAYMKYAILWGWRVNAARGIEPQLPDFDEENATWEGLDRLGESDDAADGTTGDG